ncbi:MAG: CvpA family protein [Bacteroidales bacterium]|nr:CvpA family protein [Bacteroidales bacterium]
MNVLDVIIGIVLVLFAITGLRKGLIVEAFYLASFLFGAYGAMHFSDAVADWMSDFINVSEDYLTIISFIVTFIIVLVLVRFLGRIISRLLEAISLGFLDKIGGFIFGVLKGTLLVSVLVMVMNVFGASDLINDDLRKSSKLYTLTDSIANTIYDNREDLEDRIEDALDKSMDKIDEKMDAIENIVETSLTK